MTINKAIEILNEVCNWDFKHDRQDCDNATKLGVEALKYVKQNRHRIYPDSIPPLPGEDPE